MANYADDAAPDVCSKDITSVIKSLENAAELYTMTVYQHSNGYLQRIILFQFTIETYKFLQLKCLKSTRSRGLISFRMYSLKIFNQNII